MVVVIWTPVTTISFVLLRYIFWEFWNPQIIIIPPALFTKWSMIIKMTGNHLHHSQYIKNTTKRGIKKLLWNQFELFPLLSKWDLDEDEVFKLNSNSGILAETLWWWRRFCNNWNTCFRILIYFRFALHHGGSTAAEILQVLPRQFS